MKLFWRKKTKVLSPKIDFIQEMKVLNLKPGDVVILKTQTIIHSRDAAESLRKAVADYIGGGIKVMLLEEGMDIGVLRQEVNSDKWQLEGQ